MRLVADENIEKPIVEFLRDKSFDVFYIIEAKLSISDEEILNIAKKENRILITNDKDFGELIFYQKKISSGVLLIRSSKEKALDKVALLETYLAQIKNKLFGNFIVLSDAGVRIRKLLR